MFAKKPKDLYRVAYNSVRQEVLIPRHLMRDATNGSLPARRAVVKLFEQAYRQRTSRTELKHFAQWQGFSFTLLEKDFQPKP